jgi:hypothetical protein
MRSSFFWYVTQRRGVVSCRHFGTICRSQLQASSSLTAWSLEKGPLGCPETSGINYQSTLCNIPEERISHYQTILSSLFHSTTICMYILFHDVQATPYHNWRWKWRWLGTGLNMFLGLMTLSRKPIGFYLWLCDSEYCRQTRYFAG